MADNTKTVTVGVAATEIVGLSPYRKWVLLHNNGAQTVFIGFSATDCDTDSMPLLEDAYMKIKNKGDPLYGIVAAGTCDVRVMENTR